MLSLNVRTKMKPEAVVKKAVSFFGPGGYALKVTNQDEGCADFEGGGGGVSIKTCADTKGTSVDIITTEWEKAVEEFARTIKDAK